MAKFLLPFNRTWSNRLLMLHRRYYGSEFKGSWNEAPTCGGRQTTENVKKCHPREGSCSTDLSACPTVKWPECGEPDIKSPLGLACCCDQRLIERPCTKPARKIHQQEEKKPFTSMWEVSGIEKECPDLNPRFDETHYVSSDKRNRIYTRTWESCKPMIRKRKVCCIDGVCLLPPIEKRAKGDFPPTAKERDSEQLKVDYNILKKCLDNVTGNPKTKLINKCRKIVMPCCRNVAKSTKCHHNRERSKCSKECCPHPSFSECDHPAPKKEPAEECRCSHFPSVCETSRFLIRKNMFHIPPPLPAWPTKEKPK